MLNVLIVEDSHEVGRLIKEALLSLDSTIEASVIPSAEEAMLEVAQNPVNLLVVDIRLPGISGLDLVKKLRARQPELKVIVITGMTDEAMPGLAAGLGVDGFFRKPVEMIPFMRCAAQCLGLEFHPSTAPESATSLPEVLAGLRHTLGAHGVFLLDGTGAVLAQFGMLPKGYDAMDLFPSVLAAQKPTQPLPAKLIADNRLVVYWEVNMALAVIRVDADRWLAATLAGGEAALMNPTLLPGMLQAALSLAQLHVIPPADQPLAEHSAAAETSAPIQTPPEQLEALSALLASEKDAAVDAEAFWEQAASPQPPLPKDIQPGSPAIGQVLADEE